MSPLRLAVATGALGVMLLACAGEGGPTAPDPRLVARVVVTPSVDTLRWIGATRQLEGRALNSSGSPVAAAVTWTTLDTDVVQVSATGLVSALGTGTATVKAHVGLHSAIAVIEIVQEPATIQRVSGDGQVGVPQGTLPDPLVVEVRDHGGNLLAGTAVTWIVDHGGGMLESPAGQTDAEGRASARWRLGEVGGQVVRAVSGSASVSFIAQAVGEGTVRVTSVSPDPMLEGEEATLHGSGFDPAASGNTVTVEGVDATVLSADSVQIRFVVPYSDCRPPRFGTVTVTGSGGIAGIAAPIQPSGTIELDIGDGYVYGPGGCIQLPAAAAGTEYLIGVMSRSETVSLVTPASLSMRVGETITPSALQSVSPPAEALALPRVQGVSPAWHQGDRPQLAPIEAEPEPRAVRAGTEERWWEMNRPFLEPGLGSTIQRRSLGAASASVVAVGDTVTLYEGAACTGRNAVTGLVRKVGSRAVWIDDTSNPAGGLSSSQWASLDAVYTDHIAPTITESFGALSDVDGNGRILVLMTRRVNEASGGPGYVFSGDLLGSTECTESNQGEILFAPAPDPTGSVGDVWTTSDVLERLPPRMAHDVTHLVQFANLAANKLRWELEGGATLAEQLVGMGVLGHGTASDLGYAEWSQGEVWYGPWAADMAAYFGASPGGRVPGAPERCSWIGTEDDGNTGPCEASRAVYGVPAMLFRHVLDAWGRFHAGGAPALMRDLTASTGVGVPGLAQTVGVDEDMIMVLFYAALWVDGRVGDWFPSWDLQDILSKAPGSAQLVPYETTSDVPSLDVQVRGGSNAYLHWRPVAGHAARAARVRGIDDTLLPDHMSFWILRTK